MVGWHHWRDGREFEWAPGVGDGQGSLCSAVHGVAKSQSQLSNWTELNWGEALICKQMFVKWIWPVLTSFQVVVLEKTLESPLDCKEIQPVNTKGNQPWMFIGRTDADAEAPILLPPDAKSWLVGKDLDTWKHWGQEKRAWQWMRWLDSHHWLNAHESEQTSGDSEGQESLVTAVHRVRNSWTQLRD